MITQAQTRTPEDINPQYAMLADVWVEILGGNMHAGYWTDGDDASMAAATNRLTDIVIERLNVLPGQRVLDVGCGSGAPAVRVVQATKADVVSIDIGGHQLHLAKERVIAEVLEDRITVQYADVNDMPFANESFDAAWSSECLVQMTDWTESLRHIARVLRPGGRLVVTDCVERAPVDSETRAFLDDYYATVHCRYSKLNEIPRLVRDAGLELAELTEIGDHILKRTMKAVGEGFRERAKEIEAATGIPPQITGKIGEQAVRFSELPEAGYMVMVARKPLV
jgi:cyclopropane fatty-acyl-phospholipid synthase-like methyltransferase